jgi:anti-sigma factor RsiW
MEERRVSTGSGSVHTMTGAYALHALDEFEQRHFEKHLATCPECRVEVTGFAMAAAHLCLAVAQRPSPRIRVRVLAQIADVRQLPPVITRAAAPRWPWRVRVSAVVAAGALVGAAAMAVVLTGTEHQLGSTHSSLAQAESVNTPITMLLSQPDVRTVTSRSANGSAATAISSDRLDAGLLTVTGIRRLPADSTYQAWLVGPDGTRSAGLLGAAGKPLPLHGLSGVRQIAVTTEPAGGSTVPTTIPVIVVGLA